MAWAYLGRGAMSADGMAPIPIGGLRYGWARGGVGLECARVAGSATVDGSNRGSRLRGGVVGRGIKGHKAGGADMRLARGWGGGIPCGFMGGGCGSPAALRFAVVRYSSRLGVRWYGPGYERMTNYSGSAHLRA